MTLDEVDQWLDNLSPALEEWGKFVVQRVSDRVRGEVGERRFQAFFKVQPSYRVKGAKSAFEKIDRKGYTEPGKQITDLVGARFIVLVRTDIDVVEEALAHCTDWTLSRERDPSFEISQEPTVFDYQSVHYLARNKSKLVLNDIEVPADLACEVQVRTLLQHAYAELVHDNIYKPAGVVPSSTKRLVARCMALMETTDSMFCEALEELNQVNTEREEWLRFLPEVYAQVTGHRDVTARDEDTMLVLSKYRDWLKQTNREKLRGLVTLAPLAKKIASRMGKDSLFDRPMCLLVYSLIDEHGSAAFEAWPIERYATDVRTIMADLGKASKAL
jgi:ppGpp synthetase/RelA/SpoT-type nucleotidyltranferase